LQDEGIDCSSHHMRAFCVEFLKVPKRFPKFPMQFHEVGNPIGCATI
jgi:hypothetical protein